MDNFTEHEKYAAGLRALADWYERHQDIPLADTHFNVYAMDTKDDAKKVVRALGSCRKEYRDSYLHISKTFESITLTFVFTRNSVCRKKVVAVETIPAKFIEAHIEPARTKEIVEWECEPILAATEEE